MGNLCCNELMEKNNEHTFEDFQQKKKTVKVDKENHSLFTVVEMPGEETGQSYLRYSADKYKN